jgi:hypothetical protein
MATAAVQVQPQISTKAKWIISERTDILWFTMGGAAAAYAFWAIWKFAAGYGASVQHAVLLGLVAVWAILFDETHGFATISRTYFDDEERQKRGRWLWGSLAFFFAIGPVLILLRLGDWLELGTELWGYYHIFKQHYGFMMMYKKKNRDFAPQDMRLDKIFFAAAFYYPFITYPLHDKEAAGLLPFPIPPRLGMAVENVLLFALLLIALVYVVRQVQKWREGLNLNWPKQVLFAAAIPVNFLLFRSQMPLLGVYAAATIFHNIQYHRLVWFYNQNKYGNRVGQSKQYGMATLVSGRWLFYVAAAGVYALIFDIVPRFVLRPAIGAGDLNLRNQLIFAFFAAPGLLHYWIDGHIWKVRSDPSLKTYLQL